MAPHPHLQANREAKARRIADALCAHLGPDSPSALTFEHLADQLAAQWTDTDWAGAARLIGEKAPSPETRTLVIALVRARAHQPVDPFAGLSGVA